MPQPQQHQTQPHLRPTYPLEAYGNTGSLTHQTRPDIKPTFSQRQRRWILNPLSYSGKSKVHPFLSCDHPCSAVSYKLKINQVLNFADEDTFINFLKTQVQFFFFFFFFFFWLNLQYMEVSKLGVKLHHSLSNMRSQPYLQSTLQLTGTLDPYPRREARDRTHILMDTSGLVSTTPHNTQHKKFIPVFY